MGNMEINEQELADVIAAEEAGKKEARENPGICICGHPMKKHTAPGEIDQRSCLGVKAMHCGCPEAKLALRVPNARYFGYKTDREIGHALTRGIARTVQEYGREAIERFIPLACMYRLDPERDPELRCGSVEDVRVVRDSDPSRRNVYVNGYACRKHRMQIL